MKTDFPKTMLYEKVVILTHKNFFQAFKFSLRLIPA